MKESPHEELLAELRDIASRLPAVARLNDAGAARKARKEIERIAHELHGLVAILDPVKRPSSIFDPSNPAVVGRMIAMTLVAQERQALGRIEPFYGSGVYAIYYRGGFAAYRQLANTEHPIYLGKTDPAVDGAKDAVAQGTKLHGRLSEHARSITKAQNLRIDDFQCRFLIVSSGWQTAAEDYLIQLFKPIWNTQIDVAFGIGKHGDAAKTRQNLRSPWDTLHPGRPWAAATAGDQKSVEQIQAEIRKHLSSHRPYRTAEDLLARFMGDMRQLAFQDTGMPQPQVIED